MVFLNAKRSNNYINCFTNRDALFSEGAEVDRFVNTACLSHEAPMTQKQKLELTWIGKEYRPKLEPRILLEDPEQSYHAPHRVTDHDLFDNRLIFGDNLLALKALEAEFTSKVKCVFMALSPKLCLINS